MKRVVSIVFFVIFSVAFCAEGISGVSYLRYNIGDFTEGGQHGFSMDRVYLTYSTKISDEASFKFQSDVQNKFSEGQAFYMYIKKAQFDLKLGLGAKATLGIQGMNMFNIQEKTWGYRFISKSAMDVNGWSASADMGFGLSQSFGENIYTSFLYTNGEGYKKVSADNNMKISVQAVYGEKRLDKNDGYNAGVVYSTLKSDQGNDETSTASVTGLFGGWAGMGARLGFEYNMHNTTYSADGMEADAQTLMSFYANQKLINNFSVMARYDSLEPDADVENDEETKIIVGLAWTPTKGFTVSPNMVQTKVGDGDAESEFVLNFQIKF